MHFLLLDELRFPSDLRGVPVAAKVVFAFKAPQKRNVLDTITDETVRQHTPHDDLHQDTGTNS